MFHRRWRSLLELLGWSCRFLAILCNFRKICRCGCRNLCRCMHGRYWIEWPQSVFLIIFGLRCSCPTNEGRHRHLEEGWEVHSPNKWLFLLVRFSAKVAFVSFGKTPLNRCKRICCFRKSMPWCLASSPSMRELLSLHRNGRRGLKRWNWLVSWLSWRVNMLIREWDQIGLCKRCCISPNFRNILDFCPKNECELECLSPQQL